MSSQPKPVQRPWRSYLRFSVRGLAVLVLLIGSWLGWIVRSARIQRDAVAAINEAGGYAYYDWEWGNRGWRSGGAPNAPTWLVKQLGVDYFSRVVRVEFDEKSGSDAKLVHVGHFPALESLLLANCRNVGSYGLTHLHGLTNLSELDVSNTFVGDSGLAHLEGLRNLSTLNLAKTRITDAGMIHLRRLTELTSVDLRDDQVRSAGLAHLAGSTGLTELWLSNTEVSDAGLEHLRNLTNLTLLDLKRTAVKTPGWPLWKG